MKANGDARFGRFIVTLSFLSLEFEVDLSVLSSQPEVAFGVKECLCLARGQPEPRSRDNGTGSGNLAAVGAQQHRPARVITGDHRSDTPAVVARNAARHGGMAG